MRFLPFLSPILTEPAKNRVLGDVLCLLGALGYAVSNICQEASVKRFHLSEFLAFIGLFGSIICGTQGAALEHNNIGAIHWTGPLGIHALWRCDMSD